MSNDILDQASGFEYQKPDPLLSAIRKIDPVVLTQERGRTHGDWFGQSALAQSLKRLVRESPGWQKMQPFQREAVEMILVKVSRICCGDPSEPDHWNDIQGYAELGRHGHEQK